MSPTLWLLIITAAVLYIYNYYKNRRVYKLAKKFPGPTPLPLLGNSLDFAKSSDGIFSILIDFSNKYGRFFRVWNSGKLFVFCKEHQDAEVLLGSNVHITKSDSYRFIIPWIGTGLLTATGNKWRAHRKIITPTFHFKILYEFLDVFNRNAAVLCEILESKVGKGPFNIYDYLKLTAMDNIYETAMGMNMDIQKNSETNYVKAVKDMCNVACMRFFKVWLMIDLFFNLSKYSKIQEDALKVLREATENVLKERREEFSKIKKEPIEQEKADDGVNEKKRLAFLDLLLKSTEGWQLTNDELREEVDTFLFAGHDTVSSAFGFTLYCLANYPEVQEKTYQEQVQIFGDDDRMPTHADIQEMKYMEMVIKEVERLYPSAPIIGRELHEDLELPGNYIVPKGTQLNLNIFSMHRDPRFWPNPEVFNPDNFLPEAIQGRHPYCYVPFSAGPRNCIGQKYAMLELKSTVSQILRKFKLLPSPYEGDKLKLAAEIVLISTTGFHVKVEKRK